MGHEAPAVLTPHPISLSHTHTHSFALLGVWNTLTLSLSLFLSVGLSVSGSLFLSVGLSLSLSLSVALWHLPDLMVQWASFWATASRSRKRPSAVIWALTVVVVTIGSLIAGAGGIGQEHTRTAARAI